jgi:hypothetical protein
MIKDYMALLQNNFNNDAPPFRKLAKLFDLGETFDSLDGHYYGVCPGLRTGDLHGAAADSATSWGSSGVRQLWVTVPGPAKATFR